MKREKVKTTLRRLYRLNRRIHNERNEKCKQCGAELSIYDGDICGDCEMQPYSGEYFKDYVPFKYWELE